MKQVFIIGLSKFGSYLATELYERGFEVIAIDQNEDRIEDIKDKVSQAIVGDATDIEMLKAVGIEKADLIVICIGTNLGDSILIAFNLVELGVKQIIAKARSEAHGRILEKIGVNEIILPEKDTAILLAKKIHNPNMIEYIPFIEGYIMVELSPPHRFIGQHLKDINLINEFGVQVIAIKDVLTDKLNIIPTGNYVIKDSDLLILLGPRDQINKLKE